MNVQRLKNRRQYETLETKVRSDKLICEFNVNTNADIQKIHKLAEAE